jgi:hypothetical protein
MSLNSWLLAGVIFIAVPAFANEKGNGGDACKQVVVKAQGVLLESLRFQGQDAYPEFKFEVLKELIENSEVRVVPRTTIGGEETDAKNYPTLRLIELNRSFWCALDFDTKVSILFHEYLGLMELETGNDYRISSRLEVVANPKKWHCSFPVYPKGIFSPPRDMFYAQGYGPTAEAAFKEAMKKVSRWNYDVPCWQISPDRKSCVGVPGITNSCVRQ